MRMSFYAVLCSSLAALVLLWSDVVVVVAGDRWYPYDYYDDGYPPPAYYPPPAPPPVYRAPPPAAYEPLVYGWSYAPPPAPSSCGVYRFWNGERCADARDELPYIGPRW